MASKGFPVLSDIQEQPTEWLWVNHIPLGELTLVEGHPGVNKSSLTYDVAARVTRGTQMPCAEPGQVPAPPDGVLFLVAEDSIAKTVKPRLLAAGADLARVGVVDDVSILDDPLLLNLKKAIRKVDARLVVVDTVADFLNCNILGNKQVRQALRPLRKLAETTNTAVLLLRHFIKSRNGSTLLKGGGSVAFTSLARAQLKVYQHPDDPHLRVLIQDKNSLGPCPQPLLFEVVPEGDTIRLEWHGPSNLTVDDLEQRRKGSPKLDAAQALLFDILGDGPKEVNSIIAQARGICSKRTLDEAKRNLDVQTARSGNGRDHKVFWQLPSAEDVDGGEANPLPATEPAARSHCEEDTGSRTADQVARASTESRRDFGLHSP